MMYTITFDRPARNDETPEEAWVRRIDCSKLKLGEDLTAEALAEVYPDVNDEIGAELAERAINNSHQADSHNGVLLEHFPSIDDLDGDTADTTDSDVETKTDEDSPFRKHQDLKDTAEHTLTDEETVTDGGDTTTDLDVQTQSAEPSSPEATDPPVQNDLELTTERTSRSASGDLDRDTLEAEVEELRETLDGLEEMVNELTTITDALRKRDIDLAQTLVGENSPYEAGVDADEITDLLTRSQNLDTRVAKLEGSVQPDPASKPYKDMERDDKVWKIRVATARKALKNDGRSQMDYNDVLSLFDQHPSEGHCYKLLKLAGNLEGFNYEKCEPGRNDRLSVAIDDVTDDSILVAASDETEGMKR